MAARAQGEAKAGTAATLRLRLLGTPRLERAGGASLPLERLLAALLARLALEGPLSRPQAAALLWPGADDASARNNLRQRLFRLRQQCAGGELIAAESMLALARGVTHDLADAPARLDADPDALHGELLGALRFDDNPELAHWVDAAREQWALARREALAQLAARREAEGRLDEALHFAERLVADDPLREHAHRRVMRLHYLRGDRAAALAAWRRCRESLERELQARPARETLELARMIEDAAPPARAPVAREPVSLLRPPRLVGRERERAAIESAFEQRRIVLVEGEPGIGKTRLASDVFAACAGSAFFAARSGDARAPYTLAARLLRGLVKAHGLPGERWMAAELARIAPDLGAAATSPFDALRFYQASAAALAHWQATGLAALGIDDLQHADEASVEWLLWLLAQDAARALPWLLAVRSAEAPAALRDWRAGAEGLAVVNLPPLDRRAVAELLDSLGIDGLDADGWAAPLARHTGGNPMFILETLRAMLGAGGASLARALKLPQPASCGQLIERRLAQLSGDALRLARVAALAGADFDAPLAAAVLGRHAIDIADAWRELEAAQVIRDQAFAHDLILEATLRSVPDAIARVLHGQIAEQLEARGGDAARIARHWHEAREWARAGRGWRAALEALHHTSRGAHAAELARRAAECFDKAELRPERMEALWMLSGSLQFMKRFDEYRALGERMMAETRTREERVFALDILAKSRFEAAPNEEAVALLREGRMLAHEVGHAVIEVSLAEWESLGLALLGRHEEALEVGRVVLAYIESHPDDEWIALRQRQYAYLLELDNRFEAAHALLDLADRRALADGDICLVSEIRVVRAACAHCMGDLPAAIEDYQSARRLLIERSAGTLAYTGYDAMLARTLCEAGRFREAIELLLGALDASAGHDDAWSRLQCQAVLSLCYALLGQGARATRLLEAPSGDDAMLRSAWANARLKLARAEGKRARAIVEEVIALAPQTARRERVLWQAHTELARELEDAPRAIELTREVTRASLAKQARSHWLPAQAALCDALRRAGRAEEASREAERLMQALAVRSPVGGYAPDYWWAAFQAYEVAGEAHAARAEAALQGGIDWLRRSALPHVAPEFRDSFLNRNPVNAALLEAARRRRLTLA